MIKEKRERWGRRGEGNEDDERREEKGKQGQGKEDSKRMIE